MMTVGAEDLIDNLSTEKKCEFFLKHAKRIKKEKGADFAEQGAADIGSLNANLKMGEHGVWAYCHGFQKWTDEEKKMSEKKFMDNLDKFSEHLKVLCENNDLAQKMMMGVVGKCTCYLL